MQPNQPTQPTGPSSQPPYHPPEYVIDPTAQSNRPTFDTSAIQQHPSGTYEVVPPIPANPHAQGSGHNPYDFIVAANAHPKRTSLGNQSLLLRIGIILGGIVVIVIIVAIVLSALTPQGGTPGLTSTAERQQEIIRISTAASKQISGQDANNFATNVSFTITSSQQQIISYLSAHGVKTSPKTLALDHNSQTDTLLSDAASAGTYDTVAPQTLADQLQTYASLLRTTYKQTNNKETRQLLQGCFTNADTLLKQYRSLPASNS